MRNLLLARELKGEESLLGTLPQQSIVNWARVITEIEKVLVAPLEFLDGTGKVRDNCRVRGETLHGPNRERNAFLGRNSRHQFVHHLVNQFGVIRSSLPDRLAFFGRAHQHVR
jgi:hypothetical protein